VLLWLIVKNRAVLHCFQRLTKVTNSYAITTSVSVLFKQAHAEVVVV